MSKINRKAKKSYTLSPEVIAFLETERKKQNASSVSAILEEILQTARREYQRAANERAFADYYSSLSKDELNEQQLWGEFSLSQFPTGQRD
jgi:hypothetical protein